MTLLGYLLTKSFLASSRLKYSQSGGYTMGRVHVQEQSKSKCDWDKEMLSRNSTGFEHVLTAKTMQSVIDR